MFQWFMWLKHNAYTLNRFFNHSSTTLLKINRDLVYLCVTSDIKNMVQLLWQRTLLQVITGTHFT